MRTPALLALGACCACHALLPRYYCPSDLGPGISCEAAQEALAAGRVESGIYGHCGISITIQDAGTFAVPERCDIHARCDGGFCPDAPMAIE